MSNIVKKCPKDGIVYDAAFGGACESCFGPLQFYCKAHDQWLVDETCNLCPKPAGAPPPAPTPSEPKGYWFGLAMVAVLAVLIGSGLIIWRMLGSHKKPRPVVAPVAVPTPPPAPKPVPAPPLVVAPVQRPAPVVPTKPAQPPVALSLHQMLDDPEPYLGKLVKTPGALQFKDTAIETFDLRQGDFAVPVQYAGIAAAAKSLVTAANPGREFVVIGILRRDETLNAIYIVAQQIEAR